MPIPGLESVPRYAELVYRLLGEDTEFIPPGFVLEDDRPEYGFLKREMLWVVQPLVSAAVAAQASFVQIFNNTNNRIITVQGAFASRTTAGRMNLLLTTTVRGATGGAFPIARDTRWNGQIAALAAPNARDGFTVSQGQTAAFGSDVAIGLDDFAALLLQPFRGPFPVILGPGVGLLINNATVNDAITVSFFGYSRVGRPEEVII